MIQKNSRASKVRGESFNIHKIEKQARSYSLRGSADTEIFSTPPLQPEHLQASSNRTRIPTSSVAPTKPTDPFFAHLTLVSGTGVRSSPSRGSSPLTPRYVYHPILDKLSPSTQDCSTHG